MFNTVLQFELPNDDENFQISCSKNNWTSVVKKNRQFFMFADNTIFLSLNDIKKLTMSLLKLTPFKVNFPLILMIF